MIPKSIDPLTATVHELQTLLQARTITSVDLVELYLAQIDRYNLGKTQLRAIIATPPVHDVFSRAKELDRERVARKLRSKAHGIPILIKIWMNWVLHSVETNVCVGQLCSPSTGMGTTSGTFALLGSSVEKDAGVVSLLHEAGCIILGKCNMSVRFFDI
jgi:amidase